MAEQPAPKKSAISLRNIIRIGAFALLLGAGALYLMKPGPKAAQKTAQKASPKRGVKKVASNPLWPSVRWRTAKRVKAKPAPKVRDAAARPAKTPKPKSAPKSAPKSDGVRAAIAPADATPTAKPVMAKDAGKTPPQKAASSPATTRKPTVVAGTTKSAGAPTVRNTGQKTAQPKTAKGAVVTRDAKRAAPASKAKAPVAKGSPIKPVAARVDQKPATDGRKTITKVGPAKGREWQIVPHEAVYSVRVYPFGGSRNKPYMQGAAELRYMLYCGKWTFQWNFQFKSVPGLDLAPVAQMYVHKEMADGRSYSLQHFWQHGGSSGEEKGTATIKADGTGEAFVETRTSRSIVHLPKDTVFPVEYLERLIKAAKANKPEYISYAYGKSSPTLLLKVRARISDLIQRKKKGAARKRDSVDIPKSLQSKRVWRVDYAYFDAAAPDQQLPFQTSIAINAKGLTLWTEMDIGDARMVTKLERVHVFPDGPCRDGVGGDPKFRKN